MNAGSPSLVRPLALHDAAFHHAKGSLIDFHPRPWDELRSSSISSDAPGSGDRTRQRSFQCSLEEPSTSFSSRESPGACSPRNGARASRVSWGFMPLGVLEDGRSWRGHRWHSRQMRDLGLAGGLPMLQKRLVTGAGSVLEDRNKQKAASEVSFFSFPSVPKPQADEDESQFKVEEIHLRTRHDVLMAHYVPVYVMLPLDAVTRDNVLSHPELLACNLRALKAAGVDGVMADIWWGLVEGQQPRQYDWSAYLALFRQIESVGLKIQVVMSFHQCGGNTGDSCFIPLPAWVLQIGVENQDIFFTNRQGMRNAEYLSFGIDEEPVLQGRTAVQVYYDFMRSFREHFSEYLARGIVTEIEVGLGPAGELRYPSYPETHGWRFPGIGEFQCYDKYLLADLRDTAHQSGRYDWGYSGPHDAGRYNDWPQSTGFFCNHGSFATDYGRFFLQWYSDVLLRHGDRVLECATDLFAGYHTKIAAKVAGVHWWYNTRNHAAELAAGYYNLRERDGYQPIAKMLSRHGATLNFTCVEMRNHEQYWEARCGPEGLVQQVMNAGWMEGLEVACENALPRYDVPAFDQIIMNSRPDGINWEGQPKRRVSSFTFLRLCPDLLQERNWNEFVRFVRRMHVGLDWHPDPESFFRARHPLRRSKPVQAMPPAPPRINVASVPLHVPSLPHPSLASSPPSSQPPLEPFFSPDAPGGGLGMQVEGQQRQQQQQQQHQGGGRVDPVFDLSELGVFEEVLKAAAETGRRDGNIVDDAQPNGSQLGGAAAVLLEGEEPAASQKGGESIEEEQQREAGSGSQLEGEEDGMLSSRNAAAQSEAQGSPDSDGDCIQALEDSEETVQDGDSEERRDVSGGTEGGSSPCSDSESRSSSESPRLGLAGASEGEEREGVSGSEAPPDAWSFPLGVTQLLRSRSFDSDKNGEECGDGGLINVPGWLRWTVLNPPSPSSSASSPLDREKVWEADAPQGEWGLTEQEEEGVQGRENVGQAEQGGQGLQSTGAKGIGILLLAFVASVLYSR